MTNYKTTVISNGGNNGVFHDVTIKLDGTIEAVKIIGGNEVMTYDWSYMSTEEVYEMAKSSGHQEYTIYEEQDEPLLQDMKASEIRKAIADTTADMEDGEYEVKFDAQQGEGYTDVSLVIYDEDGEMILDEHVASVENESADNLRRAEAMVKRLSNKYGS